MRLEMTKRFWRTYHRIPQDARDATEKTLRQLESDPHHPSLRTHKRRGEGEVWQARVTRNYRLYFTMEADVIRLIAVVAHEK